MNAALLMSFLLFTASFLRSAKAAACFRQTTACVCINLSCPYLSSTSPNVGTHPPAMHFASLEFHHSQDLCEAPSLAATAHGTLFVPLQRSACDWTQVSLLPLPVMALGTDAPHRSGRNPCGSPVSRQQREGKECAVLFGFQGTDGGKRKSPLTFHAEKSRGLQPDFLIF